METRGYEFNRLLSFGTVEQLKTAQHSLKCGIMKNAFVLAISLGGGGCIAGGSGYFMVNAEKDSNGKGNAVVVMLGLVGFFGGAATAAAGTLNAVKNIDRNVNEIATLDYVIDDRTPRKD